MCKNPSLYLSTINSAIPQHPLTPPSLQEYVFRVDPLTSLGLSSDSIVCYRMGEVVRSHASEVPELLPCGYLVGDNNMIKVNLKGMAARRHGVSILVLQSGQKPGLDSQVKSFVVAGSEVNTFYSILSLFSSPPLSRCEGEQYWQSGVWHVDPETHYPAVPQPADGASSDHPLRTQRHRQVLHGCQAGRVHHFPDGAGSDGAQRGQLQRGPEFQQGGIKKDSVFSLFLLANLCLFVCFLWWQKSSFSSR